MGWHGRRMEVDRGSRTVPWQQVAAVLRADIAAGRYGPDDRLPSLSELRDTYGINRKTANKVLRRLAEEGLIEVENGVGYYVRRGAGPTQR
jgi:DNA-binding GntR family transcriptional regulator